MLENMVWYATQPRGRNIPFETGICKTISWGNGQMLQKGLGVVLLGVMLSACATGQKLDEQRDPAYEFDSGNFEFSQFLETAGDGEKKTVTVPNMGPQKVQAERRYYAASGRWCRLVTVAGQGSRIACQGEDKVWFLVPEVRPQ